jgi:hypothetical protein
VLCPEKARHFGKQLLCGSERLPAQQAKRAFSPVCVRKDVSHRARSLRIDLNSHDQPDISPGKPVMARAIEVEISQPVRNQATIDHLHSLEDVCVVGYDYIGSGLGQLPQHGPAGRAGDSEELCPAVVDDADDVPFSAQGFDPGLDGR